MEEKMEERKSIGSSSFFTSELFGSKETSSSNEIFGSIFSSSSKVLGKDSLRSKLGGKTQDFSNTEENSKSNEWKNKSTLNKERSTIYDEEQRAHPCHLSSSIYYGGQDVYPHSQNPGFNDSSFKKDGGEDDSGVASRGNWWQGSLYY